ncbi:hypothetical protein DMB37_15545 [Nocardia sp. CS682]|nr:hypothetical protein DMB37_15545 [Nocardia sp. CS682]
MEPIDPGSTNWAALATVAKLPMGDDPVFHAVEAASWSCKHWNVHHYAPLVENTMRLIAADVVHRSWFENQPWLRPQAISIRIRWTDLNTLVLEAWDIPADDTGNSTARLRYRLFQATRLRIGHG